MIITVPESFLVVSGLQIRVELEFGNYFVLLHEYQYCKIMLINIVGSNISNSGCRQYKILHHADSKAT